MRVQPFETTDLPQLRRLVNLHLAAAVPGWALSEAALARHLERDDAQPITDPWVEERITLCAVEGYRVLAAAHLLRYGDGPEIGRAYRGVGEIAWVLAQPERADAAMSVLSTTGAQLARWGVRKTHGWGSGLPAGPLWGVPDAWPHVIGALEDAGYRPSGHREALYGGWLADGDPPEEPPLPGLTIRRRVGRYETRVAALLDDREVAFCDVQPDMTSGGLSPALQRWAWLADLQVREEWRNRGIGRWLVRHAARWLRLAGCDRVVLSVADDAEAAGAGRFYRRFGWEVFVRETHGWRADREGRDDLT
ncbi:MAG: GNAT family N-acetyltransferase [Chloroflexi bacterium]|nr:GNAT family N-acetyltransferase [Chloroflexota bacterium]